MAFKAARTVIALEAQDLMRLQEILIDQDPEEAIAFLSEVIEEKVRCAQDDSHRPEFEGGIRPAPPHQRPASETHHDPGR